MKKLRRILAIGYTASLTGTILAVVFLNGNALLYAMAADLLFMVIFTLWVNKRIKEIKEVEDTEKVYEPFTPEYKEYYYSKPVSTGLFIGYIFMPLGFSYAVTISGQGWAYYFFMGLAAAFCYLFLWLIIVKWLRPAYRNEPAFSIDENSIDLKNKYRPIRWNEVASITLQQNIIGIKLINLDDFIDSQPIARKKAGLKFYNSFYKYHFGISLIIIRNDNTDIFETLTKYFDRLKYNNKYAVN